MMQSEFEKLIGQRIETADYKVVEYVYTWHPVISNTDGKRQIAELFKIGGMAVIKGMFPTAKRAEAIERRMRDLQDQLNALKSEMRYLKDGDWNVNLESQEA